MSDDLERLRSYRAAADSPSEDARDAARVALAHAIERDSSPAADRKRSHAVAAPPGTRRRRASLTRFGAMFAAAAAVFAAAAVLHSGTTVGPSPAAAAALNQLADIAASRPQAGAPGPGQYLYSSSEQMAASISAGCTELSRELRQAWVAGNGSGLVRTATAPPLFTSPQDRRARCISTAGTQATRASSGVTSAPACLGVEPALRERLRRDPAMRAELLRSPSSIVGDCLRGERKAQLSTSDLWGAPGCLGLAPVNLQRLPLDPSRLRAELLTGKVEGGPSGPGEAFIQVGDLLRNTDASPALRAALYRAAAGLPGVQLLGTATTHAGAHGLALAIDDRGLRRELIFNPHTSALIGEQETTLSDNAGFNAPAGTVIGWAAYLNQKITQHIPAGGPANPTPPCTDGSARMIPGPNGSQIQVGSSRNDARRHKRAGNKPPNLTPEG